MKVHRELFLFHPGLAAFFQFGFEPFTGHVELNGGSLLHQEFHRLDRILDPFAADRIGKEEDPERGRVGPLDGRRGREVQAVRDGVDPLFGEIRMKDGPQPIAQDHCPVQTGQSFFKPGTKPPRTPVDDPVQLATVEMPNASYARFFGQANEAKVLCQSARGLAQGYQNEVRPFRPQHPGHSTVLTEETEQFSGPGSPDPVETLVQARIEMKKLKMPFKRGAEDGRGHH